MAYFYLFFISFQNLNSGVCGQGANQHKVKFTPQHPVHQPQMFKSCAAQHEEQLDHLQREFLDSTQREFHHFDFILISDDWAG